MTTMINFQIYPTTRKDLRMFKENQEFIIREFLNKPKGKITYDDTIQFLIKTVMKERFIEMGRERDRERIIEE